MRLAFGGVFATLTPSGETPVPEVNFVCRGDGEQLLLDLLEHLDDPGSVAGVTWAKDGEIIHNPNRPLDRNLDQWPFPDRESLPLDFVESMPLDVPVRPVAWNVSRPCRPRAAVHGPACSATFRSSTKASGARAAPQHVVDEFKHLQAQGYGAVYFVDDHFLLQPKRIEAICKGSTTTA